MLLEKIRKYLKENKIQPQIHHPEITVMNIWVPSCICFLLFDVDFMYHLDPDIRLNSSADGAVTAFFKRPVRLRA